MSQFPLLPGRRTERRDSHIQEASSCVNQQVGGQQIPTAIINKTWCYLTVKTEFLIEAHLIMFVVYKKKVTERGEQNNYFSPWMWDRNLPQ